MDPFSTAAGVIAVIQIADRVISFCKEYLEAARDAPSDLRLILVETSMLKTILDSLDFLTSCQHQPASSNYLFSSGGPIEACRKTLAELCQLFPSKGNSKKSKAKVTLTALAWPLKEGKARKLLSDLAQHKSTVSLALTSDMSRDIKDVKHAVMQLRTTLTDSEKREVYSWLRHTDPSSLHHRCCIQHEAGTGDWILRSNEWQNWLEGRRRCLWLHGIPGAGKTILASHLVTVLKDHCKECTVPTACVYYYCYFSNRQDESSPFLRWLIEQLCRRVDILPDCLYELFRAGSEPSLVDLLHVLETVIKGFERVYIVIDALDESLPRDDLLRVVRDLATDTRLQNVSLLATSRQYIDIENVMLEISAPISMRNSLLDEDICLFVKAQIANNWRLKRWPSDLQREAEDALATKAKGMFRWVVCQIDVLQRLQPNRDMISNALATLPETLDETYERVFLQIPKTARGFVHSAIKWIYAHSFHLGNNITCPILLDIIRKDLASRDRTTTTGYLFNEDLLRDFCGCLVSVAPERRDSTYEGTTLEWTVPTARFAHYTVWEFLESDRIRDGPADFFAVDKEVALVEYSRLVLTAAMDVGHTTYLKYANLHPDAEDRRHEQILEAEQALENDPNVYYVMLSILCAKRVLTKPLAPGFGCLNATIIDLLDTNKSHFGTLVRVADMMDCHTIWLHDGCNEENERVFYKASWIAHSNDDARTLCNLMWVDPTASLVKQFIGTWSESRVRRLFQDDVGFEYWLGSIDQRKFGFIFHGTVMGLLALDPWTQKRVELNGLIDLACDYFDPSKMLISLVGFHKHTAECTARVSCPVSRVLDLGANVTSRGYWATPLQIAAAARNFDTVELLLDAGADPNEIGDPDGLYWDDTSFLGENFNSFRLYSPLAACLKGLESYLVHNRVHRSTRDRRSVSDLLRRKGARNFIYYESSDGEDFEVTGPYDGELSEDDSDKQSRIGNAARSPQDASGGGESDRDDDNEGYR
ncbi:hypothetical protein B0T21DRAFT_350542 [Apiosordaria backusii]|uniref:NACHT domain-containing protein n=1 Tax=Apiosordaria backusii TaxID=314023 RepID=A0AA40B2H2_9PEZI|nr:hypothetical protein B0T21DRAFT_350542 [Apiosordaria backusii]